MNIDKQKQLHAKFMASVASNLIGKGSSNTGLSEEYMEYVAVKSCLAAKYMLEVYIHNWDRWEGLADGQSRTNENK
jgi:hypothetical protein